LTKIPLWRFSDLNRHPLDAMSIIDMVN